MRNQIVTYKGINFFIKKKKVLFVGPLGFMVQNIAGKGLLYISNALYFTSKASLASFIAHFFQRFKGVVIGFTAHLRFKGLGFRFIQFKDKLVIRIGFTHYIEMPLPKSVSTVGYRNNLYLFSINQVLLNSLVIAIKRLYKFNKYNEKGIFQAGLPVILKVGKIRT